MLALVVAGSQNPYGLVILGAAGGAVLTAVFQAVQVHRDDRLKEEDELERRIRDVEQNLAELRGQMNTPRRAHKT